MSNISAPINALDARRQLASDGMVDLNAFQRLQNIPDAQQRAEAVAEQLEKNFYSMMMKAMRATVPDSGLLEGGLGDDNYVEMLDQHLVELGNLPRDPRFHESLVKQIMQNPGQLDALNSMQKTGA